jgi:hypothetical protein
VLEEKQIKRKSMAHVLQRLGVASIIFPLCHAFFLCYGEGQKAKYINHAGKEKKDVREIW